MKVNYISVFFAAAAALGMTFTTLPAQATEQEKQLNILATQMYMNQVAGQQAQANLLNQQAIYNQQIPVNGSSYVNRWHRRNRGYSPSAIDYGNPYSPYYNPGFVNNASVNPYISPYAVDPYVNTNVDPYYINNSGSGSGSGSGQILRNTLGF